MAAYEVLLLNTAIPQIQAAQSGDTYVVPRAIAFSAALTLSTGTANGVAFLNGSNVLTTGSALTFDGTNFNTTATTANFGTGGGFALQMGSASTYGYIGNSNSQSFIQINGSANAAPNQIQFGIASTEQMRLTSTGLEVKGNLVIGTAGKGIDFSADPSAAGMTSELLDDYEEGTWTPVCVCTGQTITTSQSAGLYTKVGNVVRAQCAIVISTVSGAAAGNTTITGLPFSNGDTSTYTGQGMIGYNDGFANAIYATWILGTEALFRSGTRSSANDGGGFTAGGFIIVEWVYIV